MHQSRRNLLRSAGAGLALAAAGASKVQATAKPRAECATVVPAAARNRKLDIISLDRLENQAKQVTTSGAYVFIAEAARDEWTLRENRRAFCDYPILMHRLAGVAAKDIDLGIDLLGHRLPYPIIAAPAKAHTFVHPGGEVAMAAGVGLARTLCQSLGAASKPLEAIVGATKGPKWFQLYVNADVGVTRELLLRARQAEYIANSITADASGPGISDTFVSLGSPFPPNFTFGNHDPRYGGRGDFADQKVGLTPDDIGFVRSVTGLPVVVKGILPAQDADTAIKAGASTIQVSNHGGRRLDGVPVSIGVLQEVVGVVKGRVPVILDSGIRRGIDVFRVLTLWVQVVAVGRPMMYGLALGGSMGVQSVFDQLRDEMRSTMLLAGARSVSELSPNYLRPGPAPAAHLV